MQGPHVRELNHSKILKFKELYSNKFRIKKKKIVNIQDILHAKSYQYINSTFFENLL